MFIYRWPTILLMLLTALSAPILADEDFYKEFNIKKKTTISDFPLQMIEGDELSDAAIGGGLRSSTGSDAIVTGKPAYAEEQEEDEKERKKDIELSSEPGELNEAFRYGQNPSQPVQIQQQPFSIPNGRTVQHNNTAFERP